MMRYGMATETRLGYTGAQRVDRPRIRIQPPVPFDRTASAALDELVLQLERNPNRWRKRILRLRKMIWERRVLGRAGR
jgi:hypothetical protein